MSDLSKKLAEALAIEKGIESDIGAVENQLAGIAAEEAEIDKGRSELRTARQDLLADGKDTANVDAQLRAMSGVWEKSDLQAGLQRKAKRLKGELEVAVKARKDSEKAVALEALKTSIANARTAAAALRATMETYRQARRELSLIEGFTYKIEGELDSPFRNEIGDLRGTLGNI